MSKVTKGLRSLMCKFDQKKSKRKCPKCPIKICQYHESAIVLCAGYKLRLPRTVNITVFMSGTFDLFNIMCKQYHWTALNAFLNGTKNSDGDGTCK